MVECDAQERKHPSINLYAGIFNSKLYSSNRGDLHHHHSHQSTKKLSRRLNTEEDVAKPCAAFDRKNAEDSQLEDVSANSKKMNPSDAINDKLSSFSDVEASSQGYVGTMNGRQGYAGISGNPKPYPASDATPELVLEHPFTSQEESMVRKKGDLEKPFCDDSMIEFEANLTFNNNGLKSGEIDGTRSSSSAAAASTVNRAQSSGEADSGFVNGEHKSGESNGASYATMAEISGETLSPRKIRHPKSGEINQTDIKGSFHGLSLRDSPNRGNPMLSSIKVVRSGSLDSSSSSYGGSSNGGSPIAAELASKDSRISSFGNILTAKSSPSSRPMGNLLGSGNQFRHGSGLGRKSSGEISQGRKSGEVLFHDHLRGSASHRMGSEGPTMNTISPSSTTTTTTNMSSAEMLFNDHLRGSATHRMVTSASSNKGNLHNNGNLVVGGMNGSVLTYGSGAARTSNAKQDESANHACAVDSALLRQVQGSSDPEDLNNSGNEYYRRGFFSEALVFYDRATMLCPSNASYRSSKGAALSGLGRLAEAVYEWEESIRLEPSSCGRAHQRVVSLYIRLGLLESADRHLRAAGNEADLVELQRLRNIERHFSRCIDARRLREWQNVIRESDAAVVAGADSAPRFFGYKCEALLRLHKPEEADGVCAVAQRIETALVGMGIISADPFLHMIRAQIDMALGRFEEAVNAAEVAVGIDPKNAEARALLRKSRVVSQARIDGNELFKSGRYFEALASYAEGLECDANNAVLLCNRAACRMNLGQWEKAVEDCNAALRLQPSYTKARMRRASCSTKLERWEDARQDYEILRREIPGDIDVARGLFDAQVALKRSRGEEVYKMKFGGDVEEVCSDEQFREAVSSPGLSVVQFITRWSDRCQQLSPFVDDLCKRHPCTNFLRVDVEEHPYLTRIESVSFIPTFKLYKNGQKVKEILGPSEQTLECAVKHYSL